ncbi:MAG: CmcJ/NvfI family oxidoreductase, partial [Gammaproteobacteria bacterium]
MAAEPVDADLKFLANLDEPLVYIPSKGGGDKTAHVGNFSLRKVSIQDGRRNKMASSLDVEGFRLVPHKTSVRDFYDGAQIDSVYHDEVKVMLADAMGAAHVEIFDDTLRSNSLERQRQKAIREPASIVHNDYTAGSGLKRLRDHFGDDPDEAEEWLK